MNPIEQGIKCQVHKETLSLENGSERWLIAQIRKLGAKNYCREEDEEVFWTGLGL